MFVGLDERNRIACRESDSSIFVTRIRHCRTDFAGESVSDATHTLQTF
jgi:hypothetical protein